MMDEEQRLIVEMIANGRLTAEEGAALLAALEGDGRPLGWEASPGDDAPPAGASVSPPPPEGFPTSSEGRVLPDFARFRQIKQHLTPETPLYIQVDDGDRVEIFIG